jgi:hypothetical protein
MFFPLRLRLEEPCAGVAFVGFNDVFATGNGRHMIVTGAIKSKG